METKIRINVLVPDEIRYLFDPDADPMFIAIRERGHIVVKPMSDCNFSRPCNRSHQAYRRGFLSGVLDGYEDGYNRGFKDAGDNQEYDSRYKGASWLSGDGEYDTPSCDGECHSCRFYDSIYDTCRYECTGVI